MAFRSRQLPDFQRFHIGDGHQTPKPNAGRFLPALSPEEMRQIPSISDDVAAKLRRRTEFDEIEDMTPEEIKAYEAQVELARDAIKARKLAKLKVGGGAVFDQAEEELEL